MKQGGIKKLSTYSVAIVAFLTALFFWADSYSSGYKFYQKLGCRTYANGRFFCDYVLDPIRVALIAIFIIILFFYVRLVLSRIIYFFKNISINMLPRIIVETLFILFSLVAIAWFAFPVGVDCYPSPDMPKRVVYTENPITKAMVSVGFPVRRMCSSY